MSCLQKFWIDWGLTEIKAIPMTFIVYQHRKKYQKMVVRTWGIKKQLPETWGKEWHKLWSVFVSHLLWQKINPWNIRSWVYLQQPIYILNSVDEKKQIILYHSPLIVRAPEFLWKLTSFIQLVSRLEWVFRQIAEYL